MLLKTVVRQLVLNLKAKKLEASVILAVTVSTRLKTLVQWAMAA